MVAMGTFSRWKGRATPWVFPFSFCLGPTPERGDHRHLPGPLRSLEKEQGCPWCPWWERGDPGVTWCLVESSQPGRALVYKAFWPLSQVMGACDPT